MNTFKRVGGIGRITVLGMIALALTACGGTGDKKPSTGGEQVPPTSNPSQPPNNPSPANSAPTISGNAPPSVQTGNSYRFQPSATDANGDSLSYSISGKPSWATFSITTGSLRGTPSASHVGTTSAITITVSDGTASASLSSFTIRVDAAPVTGPGSANIAPKVSGSALKAVTAGMSYSFQPSASDANGDTLTFSIQNKPTWATFNTTSGKLSGIPTANQVGNYAGIVITVSDGQASASLPAFAISVSQVSNGRATLSWRAPTTNTDGTALTNLAGYKVLYGTNQSNLTESVQISNPTITTYTVEDLSAGTWYFALKSYTSSGVDSTASNVDSKTIN